MAGGDEEERGLQLLLLNGGVLDTIFSAAQQMDGRKFGIAGKTSILLYPRENS